MSSYLPNFFMLSTSSDEKISTLPRIDRFIFYHGFSMNSAKNNVIALKKTEFLDLRVLSLLKVLIAKYSI